MAGPGFSAGHETKYSAQQGFSQASQTPPTSGYQPAASGFNDVLNRYKLEQTIRQLHGFHTTTDPRASFGAPFSGVWDLYYLVFSYSFCLYVDNFILFTS